eukprot:g7803.t1
MGAGRNLEETSSVFIAAMLMIFVFVSKVVENGFHHAKHWLQHNHEISLVAVLEHIKDEIMLVGTLSMMLISTESMISTWCVGKANDFVPALSQHKCAAVYSYGSSSTGSTTTNSSSSSSGRRMITVPSERKSSSTRTLLAASSSAATPTCPEGQTFFMDINAIHQVHFLIFWMAFTHIIYSIIVVLLSRYWARELEKWEEEILNKGTTMGHEVRHRTPQIPSNMLGEYLDAFKKQFTHLKVTGMDEFTAAVLRQFYIISQGKDKNYKFFAVVKEELEQDFDEICGIDSLLWGFTALSLFLEGQGSDAATDNIPMAGTIFVMILSLVIGINLMVIIERLIRDVYQRMVENQLESPITLYKTLSENAENGGANGAIKNIFMIPTPIKAELGWMGHGKQIWLWGIKFCMFEFSRKITYIIFFYQQFRDENGTLGQSCYHLSRTAASIYISLICCIAFLFYLGFKLIPMYSIATHVAMHQRKVSYMHKLAKGIHKIHQAQHFIDGASVVTKVSHKHEHAPTKRHTVSSGGSSHSLNISAQSKYVVPPPTQTKELSDQELLMQQHHDHTSEEDSHDHDADDVLPDTMAG